MLEIYVQGESWEEHLSRRGIDRDKAEPIHEIQWLRGERHHLASGIARLTAEVERHRMPTEVRRGVEWAVKESKNWADENDDEHDQTHGNRASALAAYLERTNERTNERSGRR